MLYIIRHGKTDWNARYKIQGRTDIPLNEEGRMMAASAREDVAKINFDLCYSSPLSRAYETAKILLEGTDTPIITDDRLLEMAFGEYEGNENVAKHPEINLNLLFNDPENYVADRGAESFEELFGRTGAFMKELVLPKVYEGQNILIVGHGAMNCSIISGLYGYSRADFWKGMTGNCQLVELKLD